MELGLDGAGSCGITRQRKCLGPCPRCVGLWRGSWGCADRLLVGNIMKLGVFCCSTSHLQIRFLSWLSTNTVFLPAGPVFTYFSDRVCLSTLCLLRTPHRIQLALLGD